ncbi:hypothetical protein EVS87_000695 [Bacillus altitudinis]|uniref:hypothetical protein n=1 Tax=Bacillus altitudinis TaxID=293387 RepID=UPI00107299F9|nr:hypothetical protein [Bacillus altitudinis]QEO60778.1 hypothetical protein EVS87_000695 [Bacillus altitudinis]
MPYTVTEFFDLTILPELNATKKYFEETLNHLEDKFTSTEAFTESFSIMMKKSFLITSYTILEKQLNMLARLVEKNSNTSLKLVDLRHRGIFRDYNYLIKVVGFTPPPTKLWKKIKIYNKIRNCFVHDTRKVFNYNDVAKLSNKLVPYIHFKKEQNDRYTINAIHSNIIIDFIDTIAEFLKFLWVESSKIKN